jgi:hypothetical protein
MLLPLHVSNSGLGNTLNIPIGALGIFLETLITTSICTLIYKTMFRNFPLSMSLENDVIMDLRTYLSCCRTMHIQ